jgi:pyruvate,water dikinase
MRHTYIYELGGRRLPPGVGAKAAKLHYLIRHGLRVPVTYVCVWNAYDRYQANDPNLLTELRSELREKLEKGCFYAVRSSANIEDGPDCSFAGQFRSVLGVQGVDAVLEAMRSIWVAMLEPRLQAYLEKGDIEPGEVKMAIIIQEMVQPRFSGVSFSKNPLTGTDEVIVEAVEGTGDALVQDGATPLRWVNKWGTWISRPDLQSPEHEFISEVIHQTKAIARMYGRPVDLEWVYDGQAVSWVQLREITALDIPIYSNRISKEVFPGIIKPLIWSINVPLVNGAWVRLLTELIGPHDIEPERLAALFYYRAYFDMGTFGQIFEMLGLPRETLELLLGLEVEGPEKPSFRPTTKTYSLLPRMLVFALGKLRFSEKLDRCMPGKEGEFQAYRQASTAGMDEGELLEAIDGLFSTAQEMAYCNIVTPLLMHLYNRMLGEQLAHIGLNVEDFDITGGMEELRELEPDVHLEALRAQYGELEPSMQDRIAGCSYQEFCLLPGIEPFQEEVAKFIERFGHLSDSGNDFSTVPWRERPDLILRMIVDYGKAHRRTGQKARFQDLELPLHHRLFIGPVYRRARRFRWYREAVSSLYTFGYGLFRDLFLALGDHFVRRGAIVRREDIFYLYFNEVREIVAAGDPGRQYLSKIEARKHEIDEVGVIQPPSIIYGDQEPASFAPSGETLAGIPTSRGQYTGRIRVLHGLEDFDKLGAGDVLVIPYSDIGWTPLFARAGAVVAESGGILSHSSIVAREYNIPAVVSVPGACRLEDNLLVTVDGYRGEIIVHES